MYSRYRKYAEAQGLTDYAVSVKSGVARQSISEWKNGRHQLSLKNRFKIAQILGTNNDFTKKIR
jgi:transcriptional regulator with XRE-family HTH domain